LIAQRAKNRTKFYDININFMTAQKEVNARVGKPGKGNQFYALWPEVRTTNIWWGSPIKASEREDL